MVPVVEDALKISNREDMKRLIVQRYDSYYELDLDPTLYYNFDAELTKTKDGIDAVPLLSTQELYIIYTSGTTGVSKGVVRDVGGTVVALNYSLKLAYDLKPNDCILSFSEMGWVVSHIFIVYGPLIRGAKTVLYERKPFSHLDEIHLYEVIKNHSVNILSTHPLLFKTIMKKDPERKVMEQYDLSSLRVFLLSGERADAELVNWLQKIKNVHIDDVWGCTESGHMIGCNFSNDLRFKTIPGS